MNCCFWGQNYSFIIWKHWCEKPEKWHTLLFAWACAVYKALTRVLFCLIGTATLLGGIVITFYKLKWFMQKHSLAWSRYSRNVSWSGKIRRQRLKKPRHIAQGHVAENAWQSRKLQPVCLSTGLLLFVRALPSSLPPARKPQKFLEMTGEEIKHNTYLANLMQTPNMEDIIWYLI